MLHPFFLLASLLLPAFSFAGSAFDRPVQLAYEEMLKLRVENGRALILAERQNDPQNLCAILVENYADFFTLMVSQDVSRYETLLAAQEKRQSLVKNSKEKTPWRDYVLAELKLHAAICKLFFGNEIKAAWDFRQAYLLYEQNARRYPDFLPNKKSFGVLQIMLGSVPENYRWLLTLVGMQSNTGNGLRDLKQATQNRHPFQTEALILHSLVQEIIYKEEAATQNLFPKLVSEHPDNLLYHFLNISFLKKQKDCDAALRCYQKRPTGRDYLPFLYLHRMAGDMYLYKGLYERSAQENRYFVSHFKGRHYIKDAHFKLYLAYLLSNKPEQARHHYQQIGKAGTATVEEDIYARKFYESREQPDLLLLKARLSTDGGYFQQALQYLADYKPDSSAHTKEKVEYYYRKARVYHGLKNQEQAIAYYKKTISATGSLPYYFAPNAALQLGYLYLELNEPETARSFFRKALSYPAHEYKNSIDSKAKLALAGL